MKIEAAVILSGAVCAELAPLLERVDRPALTGLGPVGRQALREINALALAERQRRADGAWLASLMSVSGASRLKGVPARTIRDRAARGLIPAERVGREWRVDVSAV